MKNKMIIPLISAMILFGGYCFGQKAHNEHVADFNRDMSLKDQLSLIQAGKNNPAKAQAVEMDAKMNQEMFESRDNFGPSNANPQPLSDSDKRPEERMVNPIPQVTTVQPLSNEGSNTQPIGITPENAIDYRGLNGSDSQPQPENSGSVINYKSIKGSNEQPVGKVPEK
jgi:hypothetical protein